MENYNETIASPVLERDQYYCRVCKTRNVKPSKEQLKLGFWVDDVLQPRIMDRTWNFANETSGTTGTLTFAADKYIEHIDGKAIQDS
jgi:hypothetical protein